MRVARRVYRVACGRQKHRPCLSGRRSARLFIALVFVSCSLSDNRLRRASQSRAQHMPRTSAGRKLPYGNSHARRVCARHNARRTRAVHGGLRRGVRGSAVLSGRRILSEIRNGQIPQIHILADGHPPRRRKRIAERRGGERRAERGKNRRNHHNKSGRKNTP